MIVINLLDPDEECEEVKEERQEIIATPDRSKMTRLQVISITGKIVEVEH